MAEGEGLTVAEASGRLGVSERTLRRLLSRPDLANRTTTTTRRTATGTRKATLIPPALLPELASILQPETLATVAENTGTTTANAGTRPVEETDEDRQEPGERWQEANRRPATLARTAALYRQRRQKRRRTPAEAGQGEPDASAGTSEEILFLRGLVESQQADARALVAIHAEQIRSRDAAESEMRRLLLMERQEANRLRSFLALPPGQTQDFARNDTQSAGGTETAYDAPTGPERSQRPAEVEEDGKAEARPRRWWQIWK